MKFLNKYSTRISTSLPPFLPPKYIPNRRITIKHPVATPTPNPKSNKTQISQYIPITHRYFRSTSKPRVSSTQHPSPTQIPLSTSNLHTNSVQGETNNPSMQLTRGGFGALDVEDRYNFKRDRAALIQLTRNMDINDLAKLLCTTPEELMDSFQHMTGGYDPINTLNKDIIELLSIVHERNYTFPQNENYSDIKSGIRSRYLRRQPVVTIMGHVDHGKTTLLDALRQSNLTELEYGKITQSIGAFNINIQDLGDKGSNTLVTFIDTPGHEAFVNMRARGAEATDLVVLIISATEGIQKQTEEVINLVKGANIPVIIAINKIDRPGDIEGILLDLYEQGLETEELGGNIPVINISAKYSTNIPEFKQAVRSKVSDLDLFENFSMPAQCFVIESSITGDNTKSKQIGASIIVRRGTLRVGDIFVCGDQIAKVKIMKNDIGKMLTEALPGTAIMITGFKSVPNAGQLIHVVKSEQYGEKVLEEKNRLLNIYMNNNIYISSNNPMSDLKKKLGGFSRQQKRRIYSGQQDLLCGKMGLLTEMEYQKASKTTRGGSFIDLLNQEKNSKGKGRVVESMNEGSESLIFTEAEKELGRELLGKVVGEQSIMIKASTSGVLDTILNTTYQLISNTQELSIIKTGLGPITQNDIMEADEFNSIILGFDVDLHSNTDNLEELSDVQIRLHKLIYKFIDDVHNIVNQIQLNNGRNEQKLVVGTAEIKTVYNITKGSRVVEAGGSTVLSGKISTQNKIRIRRNDDIIEEDIKLRGLKRFKDDVGEVSKGEDCGISFAQNYKLKEGDILESYVLQDVKDSFIFKSGVFKSF